MSIAVCRYHVHHSAAFFYDVSCNGGASGLDANANQMFLCLYCFSAVFDHCIFSFFLFFSFGWMLVLVCSLQFSAYRGTILTFIPAWRSRDYRRSVGDVLCRAFDFCLGPDRECSETERGSTGTLSTFCEA